MTPRDIIADVMPTPGVADTVMERLREAGFVIVPRKATPEIRDAAASWRGGSLAGLWEAMVLQAAKP